MKESLNKLLDNKFLEPIIFVVITSLLLEFAIFPGLTVANTFINIITGIFSILLIFFSYFYISTFKIWRKEVEEVIEPGETEFDYVPKEEIKKKKVYKKKPEQHVVHPKVKKK
jgi:hypothetical protein